MGLFSLSSLPGLTRQSMGRCSLTESPRVASRQHGPPGQVLNIKPGGDDYKIDHDDETGMMSSLRASAKQSRAACAEAGLLRRCAPRNDEDQAAARRAATI